MKVHFRTMWVLLFLLWVGSGWGGEIAIREAINPGLGPVPPGVFRTTPAAAFRGLLFSCSEGDFHRGAHYLDLTEIPEDQQEAVGKEVVEKLCGVLHRLSAKPQMVPWDTPDGPMEGGVPTHVAVALRFNRGGIAGEVWLRRTKDARSGEFAWLITNQTVSSVPFWYRMLVKGPAPVARAPLNPGLPPLLDLNRGNPREALLGFLEAAEDGNFLRAAHFLDFSAFAEQDQRRLGPLYARRLYLVVLRAHPLNLEKLSNDPTGLPEQGLSEDRERVGVLEVEGRKVELLLADLYDPGIGHRWVVAAETVANIPLLYKRYGLGWLGDHLPGLFFSLSVAGLAAWQWVALLLLVSLGFWLSSRLGSVVVKLLRRLVVKSAVLWDDRVVEAADGPVGLWLWAVLLWFGGSNLGLYSSSTVPGVLVKLLAVLATTWFLVRLLDRACGLWLDQAEEGHSLLFSFIPIFRRMGRALLILFGSLASLHVIGIPVSTALAGLGIGGVAVAFAAQKTLENIFAALAIAADRPFAVGDFVRIGSISGTVEDLGLRSTRLRTLERTLVTIPNSAVVGSEVVNFTARDRILFNPTLLLEYGTTRVQLEGLLGDIRKLLATHPRVVKEGQRCVFRGFGDSALLVEVYCWVETRQWEEYLALVEELNFSLAEIIERAGASFAFPSQTVYLVRRANSPAGNTHDDGIPQA